MRIKKKNLNEYLLTPSGTWVRNYANPDAPFTDINSLVLPGERELLLSNQMKNVSRGGGRIDLETFFHPNVVIVSDGDGFDAKHELLHELRREDVAVIAINGALAKWRLVPPHPRARSINYFVANNPFAECMSFLPRKHRYTPKLIASTRTNPEFVRAYKGTKYFYTPVADQAYSGPEPDAQYRIDDYRNPACAAIGLAFRFGVQKLLLLCPDDAFDHERPGAERQENGTWMYPAQKTCHGLVDGYLHWLRSQPNNPVEVAVHGSGPAYENARYLEQEDVVGFFTGGN